MVQFNLDISDTCQWCSRWEQTDEGRLIDRCRLGQNEIIGCFRLDQSGTGGPGQRADFPVGIACAKKERVSKSIGGQEWAQRQDSH